LLVVPHLSHHLRRRAPSKLGALLIVLPLAGQTAWTPLPTGPAPRSDLAAAFDPVRGHLLVHGGWNGSIDLDETWAFDGTTWNQLAPFPGRISSHRLALLATQGVVIAFGGYNGGLILGGTHAWDGSSWTVRQPAQAPSARYSHMMVTDTGRDRIVLFGGSCGSGCARDDTWEYDGVNWTQLAPSLRPTGRFSAGMAFDAARNHTVLFGGRTLASRVNDTWTWDGSTWTGHGTGGPSPRSTPVMDYDPARERIVLFGGFTGIYAADTWEHDGVAWAQRSATGAPPGRGFAAMAFFNPSGQTILVGGESNAGISGLVHAYGAISPARFQLFGAGCGTATLSVRTLPWLGDNCRLVAGGLDASAPGAFFLLGLSDTQWGALTLPLGLTPVGMPGCSLGVSPDCTVFAVANNGLAEHLIAIPNSPPLLGVTFFARALATDPTVLPAGLAMSAPGRAVVGAR